MVIVGLALQACRQEEPEFTIRVAVGAEQVLELDSVYCHVGEPHQGCLADNVETIGHLLDLELDGDAVVLSGEPRVEDRMLKVPVEAVSVGDALLTLRYDDRGEERVDRIALLSREITHVDSAVLCDSPTAAGRYPITTGSEFRFDLSAFAGADPLAHGDLELITDADGVTVLSPPDNPWFRDALAPDEPGARTWSLVGDSDPVELLFYEASELGASLVALDPRYDDADLEVIQAVDGSPVCVHEGPVLATVGVTGGACRIGFDGFGFGGPMPIDLGAGPLAVSLVGSGSCEVTATTATTAVTLEVPAADDPPPEHAGAPIGLDPVESDARLADREKCPKMEPPTDGNCDLFAIPGVIVLPSPDCLFSSRWAFRHNDEFGEPIGAERVGVGLTTELQVGIEYQFLGLFDWSRIPAKDLLLLTPQADFDSLGCLDQRQAVGLTVHDPGAIELPFQAANLQDVGTITVTAVEADHAVFDVGGVVSLGHDDEVRYFVGSSVAVAVTHFDEVDEKLAGIGPFGVRTLEIEGAALDRDLIHVGSTPGWLELSSPNAPTLAWIGTVDESAVDAVSATSGTIAVGEVGCLTASALNVGGAPILGQSPAPIGVAITGESLVVSAREADDGALNTLCLQGFAPGAAAIEVSWGAATTSAEWIVP